MNSNKLIQILLIDANSDDQLRVKSYLQKGLPGAHRLIWKNRIDEGIKYLNEFSVDIVLLDLRLPDCVGLEALERVHNAASDVPVVILSGDGEQERALRAVQEGAHDYFPKEKLNAIALTRVVQFGVERHKRLIAERELQAAEQVQARLFPRNAPAAQMVQIAGAARSAEKGCGDYFDFLKLPTGEIGLAVGDVSGHGMAAAMRMVELRAYLRALARRESDPGLILTDLNRYMLNESAYADDEVEQFVTLFLAVIDPQRMTLRYAGAGHVAHKLQADGDCVRLGSTGMALGIIDLAVDSSETIKLAAGDQLVIATDGLEEAMSPQGEQFGLTRLLDEVAARRHQSAASVIDGLYAAVAQFTGRETERDDMTAIVVNIGPTADPERRVRRYHRGPVSERRRQAVGECQIIG